MDLGAGDALVVLASFPNVEAARAIARILVAEKLAACVSLLPGAMSIYEWEGVLEESCECMAIIKTWESRYEALEQRYLSLHPYDVPELLSMRVVSGSAVYLQWLRERVASDE